MKARAHILSVVGLLLAGGVLAATPAQQPGDEERSAALVRRLRATREIAHTAFHQLLPLYFTGSLLIDDEGGIHLQPAPGSAYARKPRTREETSQALVEYRKLLGDLLKPGEAQFPAPVDSLCGWWNADVTFMAAPPVPRLGEYKSYIAEEYGKRPSSLRAVVELEAALVEKELGHIDKYRKLLADAVEHLDLEEFDFRGDIVFRIRMPEMLTFVRPEVCLVFLHATELKSEGESRQALTLFKTIVEHAPCSPSAWLALAEVKALDATGRDSAAGLDLLTDFYPVFWGCTHLSLDSMSRHTFKRRGHEILELVSELSEPEE